VGLFLPGHFYVSIRDSDTPDRQDPPVGNDRKNPLRVTTMSKEKKINYTYINAKYSGYCNTCYFTIFKNEKIRFNGSAHHLNCETAISDQLPRKVNPSLISVLGKVDRKRMRKMLETKQANA
jgi:hypothetical protein